MLKTTDHALKRIGRSVGKLPEPPRCCTASLGFTSGNGQDHELNPFPKAPRRIHRDRVFAQRAAELKRAAPGTQRKTAPPFIPPGKDRRKPDSVAGLACRACQRRCSTGTSRRHVAAVRGLRAQRSAEPGERQRRKYLHSHFRLSSIRLQKRGRRNQETAPASGVPPAGTENRRAWEPPTESCSSGDYRPGWPCFSQRCSPCGEADR